MTWKICQVTLNYPLSCARILTALFCVHFEFVTFICFLFKSSVIFSFLAPLFIRHEWFKRGAAAFLLSNQSFYLQPFFVLSLYYRFLSILTSVIGFCSKVLKAFPVFFVANLYVYQFGPAKSRAVMTGALFVSPTYWIRLYEPGL